MEVGEFSSFSDFQWNRNLLQSSFFHFCSSSIWQRDLFGLSSTSQAVLMISDLICLIMSYKKENNNKNIMKNLEKLNTELQGKTYEHQQLTVPTLQSWQAFSIPAAHIVKHNTWKRDYPKWLARGGTDRVYKTFGKGKVGDLFKTNLEIF